MDSRDTDLMRVGFKDLNWEYNIYRVSSSLSKTFYKYIIAYRLVKIYKITSQEAVKIIFNRLMGQGASTANAERALKAMLNNLGLPYEKCYLEGAFKNSTRKLNINRVSVLKIPHLRKKFYARMRKRQADVLEEKYGDRNYNNREKARESFIKRYGVDNVFKSEEFKAEQAKEENVKRRENKKKETCLRKYGVESYVQTREFKENLIKSNLEKYGVAWASQRPEVKEKVKKTFEEKHGGSPFKRPEVIAKVRKIMYEKYGGQPLTNKAIYDKTIASGRNRRSQNKFLDDIENLTGCKITREHQVSKWYVDGYLISSEALQINKAIIPAEKPVVFEFLGDYWHGRLNDKTYNKRTKCTMEELYSKTFRRFEEIRATGAAIFYIWETDYKKSGLLELKEYKG